MDVSYLGSHQMRAIDRLESGSASIDYVASRGYIESMKTVGVRELKDRLSEYLREVKAGESVLVTDRGAVIAEISSPEYSNRDASVPPGLSALAKRGLLTLGERGSAAVYPALPRKRLGKFSSSQLLDEERGAP